MCSTVSHGEAWAGTADCRRCALRESVLFAGLEERDFEVIHQPVDQFTLPPGARLYGPGEKIGCLYTVRSGALKLEQFLADGSRRIVRLARGGDVVGLERMLGEPCQHDAVALQETEVCRLPLAMVRALADRNPALYGEMMSRWQKALNEADAWLTQLSTGSARVRVARLLLNHVCGGDSDCRLFSREDMGAMLGISTETASRVVADFKRRGLLVESAPNRFLIDVPNLRRIAGEEELLPSP